MPDCTYMTVYLQQMQSGARFTYMLSSMLMYSLLGDVYLLHTSSGAYNPAKYNCLRNGIPVMM